MTARIPCLVICAAVWAAFPGCDSSPGLVNPDQPKDLGPPWVNKTDTQFGSSMTSSDTARNRIFSTTASDFHGIVESIANEFNVPIVVKPKKMLEWNLTVEVKGKNQEEVLKDLADKCRLTLGKSSAGHPMLVYAGVAGDEETVKPETGEPETSDE